MQRPYPIKNTISKTQTQTQTLTQPEPDCELQSQKNNHQLVVAPPENGPTLAKLFKDLNKEEKWGGGKKTNTNKNRKTKRYTKRYISKLNKRNKTRKRRN
jgi:hypothetical protein